jgi:iron(II)-dependent oxidoreductase
MTTGPDTIPARLASARPAPPRTATASTGPAAWADELDRVRRRTAAYTDLDDAELLAQHSPLMSPLVWDLAHVANYEELWLLREITGAAPLLPGVDELYDAFLHPRAIRPALPLLSPAAARAYGADVRARVLDVLAALGDQAGEPAAVPGQARISPSRRARLLAGGFVYGMVIQHEHQHDETMLATLALRAGPPVLTQPPPPPPGRPVAEDDEVLVPGGEFLLGTSADPWAYDNERPAHRIDVPAFQIGRYPVSNRAHLAFLADGGYDDPRLWSPDGWEWRCREGLRAPLFWRPDGAGGWVRRRFGHDEPIPPDEPVAHVCFYEAQAHARWAGRRLPTEPEWEKAAIFDPVTGRSRRYPWGDTPPDPSRANLGHRHDRPAALGAYPDGASALGIEQMIGDVWEWTSSDFAAYPGFVSFPYREYSEVFFREPGAPAPAGPDEAFRGYKVLRGGSWAADPAAVRATFRNWDHPIRRQIFAGFRLAHDA